MCVSPRTVEWRLLFAELRLFGVLIPVGAKKGSSEGLTAAYTLMLLAAAILVANLALTWIVSKRDEQGQKGEAGVESGRATLGDVRAEKLARALKVHPAVLLWPNGWDVDTAEPRKRSA